MEAVVVVLGNVWSQITAHLWQKEEGARFRLLPLMLCSAHSPPLATYASATAFCAIAWQVGPTP